MKTFCTAITWLFCLSCSAAWEQLQQHLQSLQQRHHIPAVGLVIFNQGKPQVVTGWGEGITAETPFRVGSISKTFTALGLLLLAEDKRLNLEQPATNFISLNNPWQEQSPVQLIHLLELTGGLPELNFALFENNKPLSLNQALKRSNPTTAWQPGLQHSYSNLPPGLTAGVIENISGESFENYQQQHVFARLRMENVNYHPRDDLPGGFKADGRTEIPYWHVTFRAFGAMNASTQAMATGLQHFFGSPSLSPEILNRMRKPTSSLAARSGFEFDYAAGMYPWVSNGHVFYGHGGDADGYRSRFGLLTNLRRGYYLVINTDNPGALKAMQRAIEATLVKDHTNTPPRATTIDGDYTGQYYPSTSRFGVSSWQQGVAQTLDIRRDGSMLIAKKTRRQTRLYALGEGKFRRRNDPTATVVFLKHQGRTYLSGELGNFIRLDKPGCQVVEKACLANTTNEDRKGG